MRYNPSKQYRRSIRLKGYDYSQAGAYFVTIRTGQGECVLGNVVHGETKCSPIGKIAERFWHEIPEHFPYIELDEFKVMPNHVHGIILIWGDENQKAAIRRVVQLNDPTRNYFSMISPKKKTLSVIVRTYKGAVTTRCRTNAFKNFKWQQNYYEHIIRNERSLNRIRAYIATNPQRWELDRENPERRGADPFDSWLDSFHPRPAEKFSAARLYRGRDV